MEKKKYKILIEGKEGIMKKLESNTTLSTLRNILKNYQIEEFYFLAEENIIIEKEDENDFTLDEILVNGNIYLKTKKIKYQFF